MTSSDTIFDTTLSNENFAKLATRAWRLYTKGPAEPEDLDRPELPTKDQLSTGILNGEADQAFDEHYHRISALHEALEGHKPSGLRITTQINKGMLDGPIARFLFDEELSDLSAEQQSVMQQLHRTIVAEQINEVHDLWVEARNYSRRAQHPLLPLIESWFKRPRQVEPMRKRTGIAPVIFRLIDTRSDPSVFGDLPDTIGSHGEMTTYLPGFEQPSRRFKGAPILQLYDRAGGQSIKKGRVAPISLRLLFELLMSVPLEARGFQANLHIPLRDLRDWFYPAIERPNGKYVSSYQRSKHLGLIQRAIEEVHNLRVEVIPNGERESVLWQPINARAIPTGDLESRARFEILMPPGSNRGALVNRHVARVFGAKSAIQYRAYISLCYFWDYYGKTTQGRRLIRSTRPVVARNAQGLIIDKSGEPILGPSGKPIGQWKRGVPLDAYGRPTVWRHADREVNPAALSRYPVLTDDDLIDLCHSLADSRTVSDNTRFQRLHQAKEAFHQMDDEGYIIVVQNAVSAAGDRTGWKILPL